MEQKNLKINQISANRKKRKIRLITPGETKQRSTGDYASIQRQVLSWDGLSAALSFSIPFIVVIAINFQSAVALVAILTAVLLPVSMLRFSMHEKLGFPDFLTVPACALVSVGITAFAAVIIRRHFPQINDSMGIYIYLFAAYPVATAVFHGKRARKLGTTMVWAFRNILYFSCGALITGIVREFLAYNRFMGLTLPGTFKLEAAKVPFFGFIVLAFILAVSTRIHVAVKKHFPSQPTSEEETDDTDDTDNMDMQPTRAAAEAMQESSVVQETAMSDDTETENNG